MADVNDSEEHEETQEEGVSQEQDTVKDMDADTRDVEQKETQEGDAVMSRLSRLEKMLVDLSGSLAALRDAQSVFVENGATIIEQEPEEVSVGVDGYVNPSELNLLID